MSRPAPRSPSNNAKTNSLRADSGWYGHLLADQIAPCAAGMFAAAGYSEMEYNNAVTAMWNSAYFDTAAFDSELNGIADGCASAGHAEVTYDVLRRLQLIPDMAENGCSLFAAWESATADGHLYQMRNLDWIMTAGIQDYLVIAIYEPDDACRHAVIGWADTLGAGGGGMNKYGIAVSEIMGHFCDAETLNGVPFAIRNQTHHPDRPPSRIFFLEGV